MTPSLEVSPTKAKEASSHEVRLAPLDTNSVFNVSGNVIIALVTVAKIKIVCAEFL